MIISYIIVAVFICGVIWARSNEKKNWNNGICSETQKPWVQFDTDSQGGRGYKSGEYTIWISYAVDKNYNHFARTLDD